MVVSLSRSASAMTRWLFIGVMFDLSVRRLRQAQVLVAFGCGVWLIVLAKGDDFNLKSVAFVGGIYLCSKILLLVADHMQHDELRRSRED